MTKPYDKRVDYSPHHQSLISLINLDVKVKLSLCIFLTENHAMNAYWGTGSAAPQVLDFETGWRLVVSLTSRPLYSQEKSPSYPLDRRLGGHGSEEKNSQPLSGTEPPIIQPVAQRYTAELSRLLTRHKPMDYIRNYQRMWKEGINGMNIGRIPK
jgi:hypothetical protein